MMTISKLNDRFGIAGGVRFESGAGGLIRAVMQSNGAEAHVYLHGAHVAHYRPVNGRDVLFMSKETFFEAGKPIRGGIPICFPWFSNAHEPAHGFARLSQWAVESSRETSGGVELMLGMTTDETVSVHWPYKAGITYRIRLGEDLEATLEVSNRSQSPIVYEEALHTYLAVGDIRRVQLGGLKGTTFMDKSLGAQGGVQSDERLAFSQYTDRVYQNTCESCVVSDPAWNRRIHVRKVGSDATVVWNPWVERAAKMEDFGDDEWPTMLCVETANVGQTAVRLGVGQSHRMGTTLTVEDNV